MSKYSQGKYAKAICDRCGDKISYQKLKKEWTGFMVCNDCWDPKTKQEFPTNFPTDAEALKQPRPDNDKEASAGVTVAKDNNTGGTPIGNSYNGNIGTISLGKVTVDIS